MQEFPPNSSKARVPDEPIVRVTSAEAGRRKKGLGRQFKETFIGGDMKSAMHYMMLDVVIPAIQDTLIDAFQGGVERLIRGENARPRRGVPSSYGDIIGHVNYGGISRGPAQSSRQPQQRMLSRRARSRQEFDEIIIPSRQEAEEVIDQMFEIMSRYGSVSVANLYGLTGIQSAHTDHKWGWTQLRGARAVPQRRSGGFLLDLPEPEAF
jgi:hypothetical protein